MNINLGPILAPPLTPEKLAERWGISGNQVRMLCREGKLRHFRPGKNIIRIPVDAVAEYEGQAWQNPDPQSPSTASSSTAAPGASSGAKVAQLAAIRSARLTVDRLKQRSPITSTRTPDNKDQKGR